MAKLTFLPMKTTLDFQPGQTILQVAEEHHVPLQHACGGFCACTTCHVIVHEGLDSLSEMQDDEADRLDRATQVELKSRLGCQAKLGSKDVIVEILHEGFGH